MKKEEKEKSALRKFVYSCCEPFQKLGFSLFSNTYGGSYIDWGPGNMLPERIFELYMDDVLLHSICEGLTDFIMGDGIELSEELKSYISANTAYNEEGKFAVNSFGDDLEDIVRQSVKDFVILGTYANDLYFNPTGGVSEIYYMDVMKNRITTSKDSVIYREKGWTAGNDTAIIPLFRKTPEDDQRIREVFFHWNEKERTIYPYPYYFAALDSVEIDNDITLYHKNGLKNGFSAFRVLYYPGTLSIEEKEEINRGVKECFSGPANAGHTMVVFDNGTGVRPEIIAAPEDNFDEKYSNAEKNVMTKIFAAFRLYPVLFGIPVEGTGFNEQEFLEVYKLALNTVIRPFRNKIIRNYSFMFGIEKPFEFKKTELELSIEGKTEAKEVDNNQNNVA